ncbi:MAG: hypothetical protein ACPGJV_11075 [Bacteriovoracaceae bacterium]
MALSFAGPDRDRALDSTDLIERAVRFGVDEAAMRNAIVRLHFYLDDEPQKFTLEYGPDDSYVIPLSSLNQKNRDDLTEREQEEFEKTQKEENKKFNRLPEFKEKAKEFNQDSVIIGVGSLLHEDLLTDFEASVYIYPSGERDESILFIANYDEVVSLTIPAFTYDFEINRYPFDPPLDDIEDVYDQGISKAQELFNDWKKVK